MDIIPVNGLVLLESAHIMKQGSETMLYLQRKAAGRVAKRSFAFIILLLAPLGAFAGQGMHVQVFDPNVSEDRFWSKDLVDHDDDYNCWYPNDLRHFAAGQNEKMYTEIRSSGECPFENSRVMMTFNTGSGVKFKVLLTGTNGTEAGFMEKYPGLHKASCEGNVCSSYGVHAFSRLDNDYDPERIYYTSGSVNVCEGGDRPLIKVFLPRRMNGPNSGETRPDSDINLQDGC